MFTLKTIFNIRISKVSKHSKQYTIVFVSSLLAFVLFSCSSVPELILPDSGIQPFTEPTVKKGPLEVSVTPEEYYTGLYHYSAEFPTFIDYPELTKQITDRAQSRFAEFEELASQNYQAKLDTMSREEHIAFEKSIEPVYSFFIRWEYTELSHNFISIKLETYQYVGGANGMTFIDTFNWYPAQNRFLSIEDIPSYMNIHYTKTLWLDYLSNNSRFFLENQINRDKNPIIADMIYQGTEANTKNFEHFTIQGNNITLWFEKYQVASGSFGILSVTLQMEN